MTIASEYTPDRYSGNDVTTEFAYGFKIVNADFLTVQVADADDDATTLTKDTHYTISGVGDEAGGSIEVLDIRSITGEVTVETVPTDWSITLSLGIPLTQLTDFHNQGAFYPETHEDAFDLALQISQQLDEVLDRCLKVTITSGESGSTLDDDFAQILEDCQTAQTGAETAEANAETAQAAAEVAQTAAETAQTGAETAETNAETAETGAQTAQAEAEAARDAVVISSWEGTASAGTTITISGFVLDTNVENIQVYVDDGTTDLRVRTSDITRDSDTQLTVPAMAGGEDLFVVSATPSAATGWDGDIADIDINGGTDLGEALVDADLFIVDNGAAGDNRKSAISRLWTYVLGKDDVSSAGWVLDENDFASDSDTQVPTQQSVKQYIADNAGSSTINMLDVWAYA